MGMGWAYVPLVVGTIRNRISTDYRPLSGPCDWNKADKHSPQDSNTDDFISTDDETFATQLLSSAKKPLPYIRISKCIHI